MKVCRYKGELYPYTGIACKWKEEAISDKHLATDTLEATLYTGNNYLEMKRFARGRIVPESNYDCFKIYIKDVDGMPTERVCLSGDYIVKINDEYTYAIISKKMFESMTDIVGPNGFYEKHPDRLQNSETVQLMDSLD